MPNNFKKLSNFFGKKCSCRFKGLKVDQEQNLTEIVVRVTFLYLAKNSIYIVLLSVFGIFHVVYSILIFPKEFWASRNITFGLSIISHCTCWSLTSITRGEMSRFFESPLDQQSYRATFKRTITIAAQIIFGIILILLTVQLQFSKEASVYDIILTIVSIIIHVRLLISLVILSNITFRFGERLHEIRKFLDKCNGRTEYENLALKMKDIIVCLNVLNNKMPIINILYLLLALYCFILWLHNMISLTFLIFLQIPFIITYFICSFVNLKLEKFKNSTLRLFDLQFITPATNTLINYFWMSNKIHDLPWIDVKFLFRATFANALKIMIYLFILFFSFEPCLKASLKCKSTPLFSFPSS
ncbi:unnamed protein product [Caenorhabditis angaria]|uniref:Uncharacterized protein n=1 Tax=Caenorhabditis angaria TaxID=860376 RepID=A0A9P1J5S0_9PELO|nr:unnamed protein product [Caenorhabditis angaria]